MKSPWLLSVGLALLVTACAQTDAGITTSVKTQLAADDTVKARNINVDTSNGSVTLTGEVRSADERTKAVQIARATKGVNDVVDHLTLVPEVPPVGTSGSVGGALSDAAITASIKGKLIADSQTSGLSINVDTADHVVTLKGEVKSAIEKNKAIEIARMTDGVATVNDQLTIR